MNKPSSEDLPGLIYALDLLREGPGLGDNGAFGGRLRQAIEQAEAAYGREHRSSPPIDYPEGAPESASATLAGKPFESIDGIPLPRWRVRLIKMARSEFVTGLLKAHDHLPVPFRVAILLLQATLLGVVLFSVIGSAFK